jgi:hypothetical protein
MLVRLGKATSWLVYVVACLMIGASILVPFVGSGDDRFAAGFLLPLAAAALLIIGW